MLTPARKRRRWPWLLLAFLLGAAMVLRYGNDMAIALESAEPSTSIGTPVQGSLRYGKRLPSRGDNFHAYSDLGTLLGRNAVHDKVRDTVVEAYAVLAHERPGTVYVYGETGWPSGGRLRPHKTHQNGMAVDFFVPVTDARGRSQALPTHVLTKFGYAIEFDRDSRWRGLRIDYEAMAAHLRALTTAAARHGLRIEVVILDSPMQDRLFAVEGGKGLDRLLRFSRKKSWVRHDEHYHVVFAPQRQHG